ncbi:lipid phosphate phosphatase 1 [Panus rudis PR-1116 ss-1]|nr:lipid phosphate phosphatase 1 [Panus rudis PR-1116 ss-1]
MNRLEMPTFFTGLRDRFDQTFAAGSFRWFDRAYIVDWAVASLFWVLAWIIKSLPPFEREFSLDDPLISHAHKPNQISGNLTWFIALLVPLGVIVTFGLLRVSAIDIHHGILGLYVTRGVTQFITEALKNRVGRLRPDFLARCKWKEAAHACTGKLDKVLDGRRSFPSGHSSTAFSGMTYLALWLAGMTGAWCLSRPARAGSLFASKIARLAFTLSPIAFATWVAVSRVEDYRHHKEDVIVGSLIGIVVATVSYLIYWPSPFSSKTYEAEQMGYRPRLVYSTEEGRSRINYDYELAGMEHASETV